MADVVTATHAKRAGVRRMLIARPPGWLAFIKGASPKNSSVWEETVNNDTVQTQRMLEHRPWLLARQGAAPRSGGAPAPAGACLGAC